MTAIITYLLATFVVIFIISCMLYWIGKRRMVKQVLKISTVVILSLIFLLAFSLTIEGKIFKDIPKTKYFLTK